MRAFLEFDRQKGRGFVSMLCCGLVAASLALASPAFAAGGGGGGGGGAGGGAGGGGGGSGGGAGGGGSGGPVRSLSGKDRGANASTANHARSRRAHQHQSQNEDLTTCNPGQVWDVNGRRCLVRRVGVLPDPELTEYAYALAKAGRYQEAIDVLDLLGNPNTPRALNYRGYATRKLGRTDEGIGYYLKSVALDPAYPQVREYLGEAYVIEGKYGLAKEQLATIEKLCGKDCEYYEDLAHALTEAHAL